MHGLSSSRRVSKIYFEFFPFLFFSFAVSMHLFLNIFIRGYFNKKKKKVRMILMVPYIFSSG
jgi:hypothetical protein